MVTELCFPSKKVQHRIWETVSSVLVSMLRDMLLIIKNKNRKQAFVPGQSPAASGRVGALNCRLSCQLSSCWGGKCQAAPLSPILPTRKNSTKRKACYLLCCELGNLGAHPRWDWDILQGRPARKPELQPVETQGHQRFRFQGRTVTQEILPHCTSKTETTKDRECIWLGSVWCYKKCRDHWGGLKQITSSFLGCESGWRSVIHKFLPFGKNQIASLQPVVFLC